MSWKKHFTPVNSVLPTGNAKLTHGHVSNNKYSSWLPEVYKGPSDRLQRYGVYESMDGDHEINSALNVIADFCTGDDELTNLPFIVDYSDDASQHEVKLIQNSLKQWCILNDFKCRLWQSVRQTLKYGDQIFIRDPETYKLLWVDVNKVVDVVANESTGKKTECYNIRDLDLNMSEMIATNQSDTDQNPLQGGMLFNRAKGFKHSSSSYVSGGSSASGTTPVDAAHIVHVSLTDGMTSSWPFGESILECIYKVFKQKELLEDAILIYRVHRAPERRAFFIDVGTMPPAKASQYIERVKYDMQQKRIPSKNGGGANIVDSTYNPMSSLEDYFLLSPVMVGGSKVTTLPGGENLGDIDDLRYFNNKMLRALCVPSSYLPTGNSDGSASYNDGRVGAAFIQEFMFSKVCERYQRKIIKVFDREFKLFLKFKGITIDNSSFELCFTKPQSFSEYRRMELDATHINAYVAIADSPILSERFKLKRYLGLTTEELIENERLWLEERGSDLIKNSGKGNGVGVGLSSAGISASGIEGMSPDGGFVDDGSIDDVDDFGK